MKSLVQFVVFASALCAVTIAEEQSLPGGRKRIDVNNSILLEALNAIQPQLQGQINSLYVHRMGKVTEAYSQVVAGLKFYVTFELMETSCLKASTTTNLESCRTTKTKTCEAEIWVQTWVNRWDLESLKCKS